MRIVFNLTNTGLGNNGGSRTIIKCAETLSDLGHESVLFTGVNRYTWHRIRVPVVNRYPKCDVLIATGVESCHDTVKRKAGVKLYYIRGFETWKASEKELIRSYRKLPCVVNSKWLQKYLQRLDIESQLIYPGLDFDQFYAETLQEDRDCVLGALFHNRHKTKRHIDAVDISRKIGCKLVMLNRDVRNANGNNLRQFYNSVKVWYSPSELEGLHNCPMEAALCGSVVVATDHPQGGTSDYVFDGKTALTYPARDLKYACEKVRLLFSQQGICNNLESNMRDKLKTEIGDRRTNMTKLIQHIEREVHLERSV